MMLCQCKPIWCLHINGFCCPCLESEEDHLTRIAELSLTTVPIRWYRKIKTKSEIRQEKRWFPRTDGVLQCSGSPNETSKDGELEIESNANQNELSCYVGIDATLDVFDTSSGPSICITSNEFDFVDDDDSTYEEGTKATTPGHKPTIMKKLIRLRDIGEISCGNDKDWNDFGVEDFHVCGVVVRSLLGDTHTSRGQNVTGRKILVFNVIQGTKQHNLKRDEIVQHLNTLASWDRRKRIASNNPNQSEIVENISSESYHKMEDDREIINTKKQNKLKGVSNKSVKVNKSAEGYESEMKRAASPHAEII